MGHWNAGKHIDTLLHTFGQITIFTCLVSKYTIYHEKQFIRTKQVTLNVGSLHSANPNLTC